jgi:CheY-like chemotaxis protein
MQRSKKLESPAAAQSREHVPRAVHKGDDMKPPVTQSRPDVKRSAASLDHVPTRKPSEKRPGAPRSNSSVNVHENTREAVPIPVRPAPAPISQPEVNPSLPRVLAVDDNSINLQLLVTFVRKAKHPHESAVDGLKAFEAYKKSTKSGPRYKYILMDISMPVMNGIQATKEIRRFEKEKGIHPPVKIIALTGMGDEGTAKKEAEEVGMDLFLSKPVKFKDLTALLV